MTRRSNFPGRVKQRRIEAANRRFKNMGGISNAEIYIQEYAKTNNKFKVSQLKKEVEVLKQVLK